MQIVVAACLCDSVSGAKLARCVNWPEPLKYVALQRPKQLRVRITSDAEGVEVSAEVPVKGVVLEDVGGEGERLVWADNCVDVVPGETVMVGVKGLAVGQEEIAGCEEF